MTNPAAFSPDLSSLSRQLRAQGGVRSLKEYLDHSSMTILLLARVWHPCLCRDSWIRICKRFYHLDELCKTHTLAVFEVGGVSKRFMRCKANIVFYVLLTQVDEIIHEVAERHLGLSVRFLQFHLFSSRLRSQFSFDCSMPWISRHHFLYIFFLAVSLLFPFLFLFHDLFFFFFLAIWTKLYPALPSLPFQLTSKKGRF